MNVIGHHAPGKQFAAFVVKMKDGVFGDLGDAGIPQMTFTQSTIQIFLQPGALLPIVFNFQQMPPFTAPGNRQGIRQPKGDELNQPRFVAVRKITAFMPAAKPTLNVILGQGTRPLALALHQIPNARIVGRTWKALGIHSKEDSCHAAR